MRRLQSFLLIGFLCQLGSAVGGQTAPPIQQPSPASPNRATLAIVGGFLIDGFGGPPRPNAVILVDGDGIVAVGEEGRLAVPPGAKVIDANGYSVMPGLIDTHVHLDLIGFGDYRVWHAARELDGKDPAAYREVMRLSAAQLVAHGVTTALDAGGGRAASIETRDRIRSGEIRGPRMLVSGHWIQNWSDEEVARQDHQRRRQAHNAHTAKEARQAAIEELDGGVDAIKVYTGVTLDQMRAITEEAHKRRKIVGAHVYTDDEIQTAVKGDVDLLHHAGSGHQNPLYSEETIRMMVQRQVPVGQSIAHRVTLYPAQISWPERLDNPQLRRELGRFADHVLGSLRNFPALGYFGRIQMQMRVAPEAASQLFKAGCRVIVGTDSGTPGNFHSEAVWREMDALVRLAGMSTNEAILAATKDAAAALRVNTGAIVPGRLADIILVKGNPLESILHLQNVSLVIRDGIVQHTSGSTSNGQN